MGKSENRGARTRTVATWPFRLICMLTSSLVMQPALVGTCLASDCALPAANIERQVDFWTNVPERWEYWENVPFGLRHMVWNLDPASKQITASYCGMGSLMGSMRTTVQVESFDGNHIVFRAKMGGYQGLYDGDLNGKSINGTVTWSSTFGVQKHKWHAQWTGGENWPTQPLCGQIQFSTGSKNAQIPVTARKPSPHVHKSEKDVQLKIEYPEHYPFSLVAIKFPADYSDTFVNEVSGLEHFQKENKEVVTKLVNEQVIKSTYLACQLYKYLKARLPEQSVILIPCKLQTDGAGKVINSPVGKPVSSVIQLDLFSWINIGRLKKPDAYLFYPDTFADKARTWLSMSMPIARKREFFAGQPVVCPASRKMSQSVESYYNVEPNGGRWKEFKADSNRLPTRRDRYADGRFMVIHQDFRFLRESLALEATVDTENVEPANKKQLRYYGNLVVDALNVQNLEEIKPVLLAEYVDDIAPDLSQSPGVTEKLSEPNLEKQQRYFYHCLAAMREQLLSKESESVADAIYAGDFGQQFRTSINAEMEYWKKALATQQRQAAAAVLFGVALGGAAGAAVTGAAAAGLFTAVAAASVSIIGHEQKLQNQLRGDFLKVWNDSRNAQVSCLFTLDNDTIEVRGDGAEAFRKNMKEAYEKRFGTLATTTGAI